MHLDTDTSLVSRVLKVRMSTNTKDNSKLRGGSSMNRLILLDFTASPPAGAVVHTTTIHHLLIGCTLALHMRVFGTRSRDPGGGVPFASSLRGARSLEEAMHA